MSQNIKNNELESMDNQPLLFLAAADNTAHNNWCLGKWCLIIFQKEGLYIPDKE